MENAYIILFVLMIMNPDKDVSNKVSMITSSLCINITHAHYLVLSHRAISNDNLFQIAVYSNVYMCV